MRGRRRENPGPKSALILMAHAWWVNVFSRFAQFIKRLKIVAEIQGVIVPFTPGGGTADAFDKLFRAEVVTLGKVIKASGAKPE